MRVREVAFLLLLVGQSLALKEDEEDTVAEDIGVHQLERLVELLTSSECEELLVALSNPEKNILQHVDRLLPKNNQFPDKLRRKRNTASLEDREAKCRANLTAWLKKYGPQMYYDRLSRALHHIGRADIALEVGKNINQDKILNLERYVEGYHQFASSLKSQEVQKTPKDHKNKMKRASDLTWNDLDLIVLRPPVPAYTKGPLDVALPLLYGILLGFGGTLLATVSTLLAVLRITNWNRTGRRPKVVCYPSYEILVES